MEPEPPLILTNVEIIQVLKRQHKLPSWFDEYTPLPPDPEKKIVLLNLRKYSQVLPSTGGFNPIKEEKRMEYVEMIKALHKGKRCSRTKWKEGEEVFLNKEVVVHTTPYWKEEVYNKTLEGYPYVVEAEDLVADDWLVTT